MSDSFYDVIFVGTELPGLIAAAMLAKKGYRVLVVGHGSRPNGFVHEGFRFVRRPWLFSGFETSKIVGRVLGELSLRRDLQNRKKPFDPFYQVVMPERRIDVVAKESLLERELRREFPGERERIKRFNAEVTEQNAILSKIFEADAILPPVGFFEQRNFKRILEESQIGDGPTDPLAQFPEDHPFRPFVLAPLLFSSGCQPPPYSPIQLIRMAHNLRDGLYEIDGGIDALKAIFIEKVTSNSSDYREKVQVDRLVMRRGKVREIVVRDRREVIGCRVIVCNTDVKRFFNLIPPEDQKERYHLQLLELQPTHWLYTVNFALKREAIPEGMGRHVFLVGDPSKPLEDENMLHLVVDPGGRQASNNADVRILSVTARLRSRNVRPTLDHVESYDERLIQQVLRVVPFLHEHFIAKASAWISFDKRTRSRVVDASEFVPIYGTPVPGTMHSSPVACRSAYKNILVAGNHLHAGLGFEGAFLGTLHTVKLTESLIDRRSPLANTRT